MKLRQSDGPTMLVFVFVYFAVVVAAMFACGLHMAHHWR